MAFSDFKTIPDVQKRFGIRHIEKDFINIEADVSPSEQFLQESDGTFWQIGHLINETFTQNRTSFSVDNLPVLFGALDAVFKAAGFPENVHTIKYRWNPSIAHQPSQK